MKINVYKIAGYSAIFLGAYALFENMSLFSEHVEIIMEKDLAGKYAHSFVGSIVYFGLGKMLIEKGKEQ